MLQSVSLKIKTKLTYGIGLLFAMIVLLGGLSVKNIYRMSADTQNILADNYNTLLYSRRMLDALERIKTDPVARKEPELAKGEYNGSGRECRDHPSGYAIRINEKGYERRLHPTCPHGVERGDESEYDFHLPEKPGGGAYGT